mmetsp:Transcript_123092/g.353640  ORF Transcript_123092/g.353640 Transcript_123092/m.353640 type:complete len:301 (+) Transcript_123092:1499-2401(+)
MNNFALASKTKMTHVIMSKVSQMGLFGSESRASPKVTTFTMTMTVTMMFSLARNLRAMGLTRWRSAIGRMFASVASCTISAAVVTLNAPTTSATASVALLSTLAKTSWSWCPSSTVKPSKLTPSDVLIGGRGWLVSFVIMSNASWTFLNTSATHSGLLLRVWSARRDMNTSTNLSKLTTDSSSREPNMRRSLRCSRSLNLRSASSNKFALLMRRRTVDENRSIESFESLSRPGGSESSPISLMSDSTCDSSDWCSCGDPSANLRLERRPLDISGVQTLVAGTIGAPPHSAWVCGGDISGG